MKKISESLNKLLNPPQVQAVLSIEGPVLVLAGAGTGKTRVITHRIAYMIEKGIAPDSIAAMTFTNKAAGEMRERIAAMVASKDAAKVFLGTFHAFCSRILRREIEILKGFNSNFTIADESDQNAVVRQAMIDCGITKEDIPPGVCLSAISKAKSAMTSPASMKLKAEDKFAEAIAAIYERYMKILENQNMLDFDDILLFTVKIFEENPQILQKYQARYKYLLVDEYQDTNSVQFKLICQLSEKSKNIFVVGDDDQSIYGWRGANIRNILEFPKHFPGCKVIALEQNYRSTNHILRTANKIISKNENRHSKRLWSNIGDGELVTVTETPDESSEAEFCARKILEIRSSEHGVRYADFAILYRSNYQSRHFEDILRLFNIPYRLVGAHSFYERREIRDTVAYLKLAVNPRDNQSFLRIIGVPPRGLGDKAIEELKNFQAIENAPLTRLAANSDFLARLNSKAASASAKFAETIEKWHNKLLEPGSLYDKAYNFLSEIGYLDSFIKIYKDRKEAEQRLDNVYELLNMMAEIEKDDQDEKITVSDFLEKYCLQDDNDKVKEDETKGDAVTLMTVHAAKGLEFENVFVTGMEKDIFPHERSVKENSIDEERRLFYVAVTRARKRLFISRASERMKFGESKGQLPSPFLEDLPEECITRDEDANSCNVISHEDFEKAARMLFGKNRAKNKEVRIYYDD